MCILYILFLKPATNRKGIGLIFPNPDAEIGLVKQALSGNANELGDAGGSPGKSFLFFVKDGLPGIGSTGERDVVPVKHRGSCGVRSAPAGP